jgi:hypothetical protein
MLVLLMLFSFFEEEVKSINTRGTHRLRIGWQARQDR